MSRLQQARTAIRPALKGRMMLSGPAGAGKTRSGLIISTVLADGAPILGIDTEKESMLTYADDFAFEHLAWHPPYDPRELVEVLKEAGDQYGVIFVDSASHFWRKEGGVLDIANGKFTGWKEARPVQEDLVDAILNCGGHVVLGVRSKVEHTQELEGGKNVVKKLGMAAQQDDDLEFEMNVAIEMSMDHTATISKSRTTVLPVNRAFKGGQVADMATIYREWLKGGEPPASKTDVEELVDRMNSLDPDQRKACKQEFFNRHGRPEQLRESQVNAARALVAGYETSRPDGGEQAQASSPSEPAVSAEGEEPGASGSDPEAKRRYTPAQKLHIHATKLKVPDLDLRAIISNCTKGRTTSAADLDGNEIARVELACNDWKEGRLDMGRIRQAAEQAS